MITKVIYFLLAVFSVMPSQAAWYEATGQATIHQGNKELARQKATQEALRQALLFAGASVRSVQQMTDGLLKSENLEIRALGEVNQLELISEHYNDDVVEVAIRADIFPQAIECSASDYKKSIATSKLHLTAVHHAANGGLFNIAQPMTTRIRNAFEQYSKYSVISHVEPYTFYPRQDEIRSQSMMLSEKVGAQYILIGDIVELSVQKPETTYMDTIKFWNKKNSSRNIAINLKLIDGTNGNTIHDRTYTATSIWSFDQHQMLDADSEALWQSPFGEAVNDIFREFVLDLDEKIACEPAFGRILEIYQNKLSVNFGSDHGLQRGDELSVFQMRQFFSTNGMPHLHYNIHPSPVVVLEANSNNAVLGVADGTPLANIQPNDFVVRR